MRYTALSELPSIDLPHGLPDIRGWEVRTSEDDEKVGKVDDLLFDERNQPHYLDIDAGGLLNPKHVLLPFVLTHGDPERDIVWVLGLTKDEFKALPDYPGDPSVITEEFELRVRAAFSGAVTGEEVSGPRQFRAAGAGAQLGGEEEARLTRSEEELAVGKRPVEAGEVAVRKTVETERVREPVSKMREEVEVERRPVEGMAAGRAEIGEDEIRVPIMEEEVVVEKRPVVKEEVVVRKRAAEETEEVEAELKKERIDVDERGRTKRGRSGRGRGTRNPDAEPGTH